MPDRPLHILKLDSILQRCGDERRPHHMGRVAMAQFELVDGLLQQPIHADEVQRSAERLWRLTTAHWSKDQAIPVLVVHGHLQIVSDALRPFPSMWNAMLKGDRERC
jgi:hypothetical protein